MQRIVRRTFFLMIVMIITAFGSLTFAETNVIVVAGGKCGENVTWELTSNNVLIISGQGEMKNYKLGSDLIPWSKYEIDKVIIEEGVTRIGDYAFNQCGVNNVELSSTVLIIGTGAFWGSDIQEIIIPEGVKEIRAEAFYNNDLDEVTIPKSVTYIGKDAFLHYYPIINCYQGSAGYQYALDNSYYHEYVLLDGSEDENIISGKRGDMLNWELNKVSKELIITTSGDMISFEKNPAPWNEYYKYVKHVKVVGNTTNISKYAFYECYYLKTISLPNSVTVVDDYSFYSCKRLKEVVLPNDIHTIGKYAFSNCSSLNSINLPSSLTTIGASAFAICENLETLYIPDGINSIGTGAFRACKGLKKVILPNSEIDLFKYSSYFGGAFTEEVTVPHKLNKIPDLEASVVICYSMNCSISDDFKLPSDGIIYGFKNSTIETFARENGYTFENIEIIHSQHTEKTVTGKLATCTETGLTDGKQCEVCGEVTEKQETIPALGHTEETIEGKAATCTETGLTDGKKCSVCGTVTVALAPTGKKNHKEVTETKAATTSKNGSIITKCTDCGKVFSTKTIYKASNVKLSYSEKVYSGKPMSPVVSIKDSNGKTISSKYYTVTKQAGRKNVGKYTYTIKFKGNYSGTKKLTFTINPKSTSVKSLTKSKKAFTVKWGKVSTQATGYEIMYATNSKFTKGKKTVMVTSYKTTSKKIASLKSKTKYYVKVRTYKTVDGKKYYSDWSKYKTVTTK